MQLGSTLSLEKGHVFWIKKNILTKSSTDVISNHHLCSHQIKMNLITAGLREITVVDNHCSIIVNTVTVLLLTVPALLDSTIPNWSIQQ